MANTLHLLPSVIIYGYANFCSKKVSDNLQFQPLNMDEKEESPWIRCLIHKMTPVTEGWCHKKHNTLVNPCSVYFYSDIPLTNHFSWIMDLFLCLAQFAIPLTTAKTLFHIYTSHVLLFSEHYLVYVNMAMYNIKSE